jgi:hypothetical protein
MNAMSSPQSIGSGRASHSHDHRHRTAETRTSPHPAETGQMFVSGDGVPITPQTITAPIATLIGATNRPGGGRQDGS